MANINLRIILGTPAGCLCNTWWDKQVVFRNFTGYFLMCPVCCLKLCPKHLLRRFLGNNLARQKRTSINKHKLARLCLCLFTGVFPGRPQFGLVRLWFVNGTVRVFGSDGSSLARFLFLKNGSDGLVPLSVSGKV